MKTLTILIISDSSLVAKSIKALELNCKLNIQEVTTPIDALSVVFTQKFDLILTNLYYSDIDGIQFFNMLMASNSLNSVTPIILMTSGENVNEMFGTEKMPNYILHKDLELIGNIEKAIQVLIDDSDQKETKVLYIEDDVFIQKMVKLWLKKFPYVQMDMISSIKELEGKLAETYDVIVSDNMLLDGEAKDVLVSLQKSDTLKHLPVLIYTGSVDKINQAELKQLGNVVDILPKPFEMKSFIQKIKSIQKTF